MQNENYRRLKIDFLDSLQPDDFRNAASFNLAEKIIDELNKTAAKKEDPREFIEKAAKNLFRENSQAVEKVIELSQAYLKIRS